MINKTLLDYANTSVELHRKLNDVKYSGDIDAEYKAFWSKFYSIRSTTDTMLRDGTHQRTLHDCHVDQFSERKQVNQYLTTFVVQSLVYDASNTEIGYQTLKFTITTGQKLRDISGCELYDFIVDTNGDAVIMYWQRGQLKHLLLTTPRISIEAEGSLQKYA